MLEIKDLNIKYGKVHALKGVDLEVKQGEIVTLIGANGAGKTSLLHAISGIIEKEAGSLFFYGKDITSVDPVSIVSMGLTQVPEGRRIFPGMTVKENLLMGAHLRNDKEEILKDLDKVYESFPRLKERAKQDANTLSGGEQQMLAMGRALMSRPKMLLLDEPSMGLAPLLVKEIFRIIKEINDNGTTILLVEQNAKMALSIADRGYVLENGLIVLSGLSQELEDSEEVKKAYLGG